MSLTVRNGMKAYAMYMTERAGMSLMLCMCIQVAIGRLYEYETRYR